MHLQQLVWIPLWWLMLTMGTLPSSHAQSDPDISPTTAPLAAEQIREITLTLEALEYPTYNALLEQASQSTTDSIEQVFTNSSDWTAVRVHILGTHSGNIVPLLVTQVSRSDWQAHPDINYWRQWTGLSGGQLLGFEPTGSQSSRTAAAPLPASLQTPTARGRNARIRQRLSGN